jgi:CubicO group peptidase (beta-lactamase class C family)
MLSILVEVTRLLRLRGIHSIVNEAMKLRPGSPEEVGMSPQRVQHLADLCRGWAERGDLQTIAALVARKGVIVMHEAFGPLTPDADSPPAKTDALFPIASITKLITATAAMILVEEGKLGLHFPVSYYVPEFAGEGKDAVTPFHLMTHTSGMRDEEVEAYAAKVKGTIALSPLDATQHPMLAEDLAHRYGAPLWKAPGKEMSYCTFGYRLLGEVISRVSGRSLADFAAERIFEPLGMKDTRFTLPDSEASRAIGSGIPLIVEALRSIRDHPRADGAAWSTAADMASFGQMFLNRGSYGDRRILSPTTVAAMTRNQIPGMSSQFFGEFFPEASWGLGWSVVDSKKSYMETALLSPEAYCHGGAGGQGLWVDPRYEVVAVYFISMLDRVPGSRMGWCPGHFITAAMATILEE